MSVRDLNFLRKLTECLRPIACISIEEANRRREYFCKFWDKNPVRLALSIISIVDSVINDYKAMVCGHLFKEHFEGNIDYDTVIFCCEVVNSLSSKHLSLLPDFINVIDNSMKSSFLRSVESVGIVNSYDENGVDVIDANHQNYSEKYKLTNEGEFIAKAVKKVGKVQGI